MANICYGGGDSGDEVGPPLCFFGMKPPLTVGVFTQHNYANDAINLALWKVLVWKARFIVDFIANLSFPALTIPAMRWLTIVIVLLVRGRGDNWSLSGLPGKTADFLMRLSKEKIIKKVILLSCTFYFLPRWNSSWDIRNDAFDMTFTS